jgi:hypothetical protein
MAASATGKPEVSFTVPLIRAVVPWPQAIVPANKNAQAMQVIVFMDS